MENHRIRPENPQTQASLLQLPASEPQAFHLCQQPTQKSKIKIDSYAGKKYLNQLNKTPKRKRSLNCLPFLRSLQQHHKKTWVAITIDQASQNLFLHIYAIQGIPTHYQPNEEFK